MPLSPEFVKYLADAGISEEHFESSSLTERTAALNNFHASKSSAPGNYSHPVNFIVLFPSHILHICILFAFDEFHLMI
jgi:hypothetical protein